MSPRRWIGAAVIAALAATAVIVLAATGDEQGSASSLRAVDVAREVGIHEVNHTYSATAFDFDGDEWEDLLLVAHKRGMRLYRNEGGVLRRRNGQLLVGYESRLDRHDCAFADVDRNGRPDFFCSVGGFKGSRPNPSQLWMQRADGTFVERAGPYGVSDPYGRGRDVTFLNADGDRWPDLLVGNQFPRDDGRPATNRLFLNQGGERFRGAPGYGLDLELGADSLSAVDLEGDGLDEVAVCGQDELPLHLFANRDGRGFEDVSDRIRGGRRCRVADFADLDGDGTPNLVRLTARHLVVHSLRDGELVRTHAREVTAGRKLAIADADGDGRPDVYVLRSAPERNLPDELLLNRSERSELRFESLEVPTDLRGVGDAVTALDHDRDGRAGFVVLNGKEKAFGAVQLIVVE